MAAERPSPNRTLTNPRFQPLNPVHQPEFTIRPRYAPAQHTEGTVKLPAILQYFLQAAVAATAGGLAQGGPTK